MQTHQHDCQTRDEELEERYRLSRRAAEDAFELWSTAKDVEGDRFACMQQVKSTEGESAAAFCQAQQNWLDACRVRAGLALRWAALDSISTAHFADWIHDTVHDTDAHVTTVRSERRTTPR